MATVCLRNAPRLVEYAESMAAAVDELVHEAREGDVILTLGAGSVSQAAPRLLEALATDG
jgi:UDP-N-acetylmuramate--alanine ligase